MTTFAVLFAGGINDFANYARYPADLSILLKSLHGFPGLTSSGISVLTGPGGTAFEFDTVAITAATASRQELQNALASITAEAKTEDRLLFFSSNHGGQRLSGQSTSTLYCWGGQVILPEELSTWCARISCGFQAFVLGQCYSGGFIGALQMQNRAILTACSFNEVSYASSAMSNRYDEFLYRIAEALVAKVPTPRGIFAYAQKADREKETPQFSDGGVADVPLWSVA